VAVAGNYAYVADGPAGLRVISVSDPAHPSEVGNYDASYPRGVAVVGIYAYVADDDSGLRVISVSDSAHPSEVGYYDTSGNSRGVAVTGNHAYVADGGAGLRIIEYYAGGVEESHKPTAISRKLEPTILSGASSVKRLASCVVFDAMGRRVTNPKPGVYFVREAQAQAKTIRKVVIQR
jgi:hypothetical protein